MNDHHADRRQPASKDLEQKSAVFRQKVARLLSGKTKEMESLRATETETKVKEIVHEQ